MKDSPGGAPGFLPAKPTSSRKRRKTDEGLAVNVESRPQDQHELYLVRNGNDLLPRAQEQPKKRGRKPKNQAVESRDDLRPEQVTGQDDNEKSAVDGVGLREKHLSSEPSLDDEIIIDLPQDQYKPRPSRSRSKRTVEEEMPPPSHTPIKTIQTPVKQTQNPNADEIVQLDDSGDTPLTKLKNEKRKKNKMKRAKTSAAALLKKSDKMLSDGEEDVIWTESKPATVKMKLPGPLDVKREGLDEEGKADAIRTKADLANATEVDTMEQLKDDTPQSDSKAQTQAPKKRGRKKKTVVEIPAPIEDDDEPADTCNVAADPSGATLIEDQTISKLPKPKPSSSRQALQEKDVNTSHFTQPQSGEADQTPQTTLTPSKADAEKTHDASTDPPKQPLQAPPSPTPPTQPPQPTTTKGPTKHSPINPSGGKVKYRVGLSRRATIPPLLKIVRK